MSRNRYSHSVYPAKGDNQPARWIALGVTSKVVAVGKGKRSRKRVLAGWTAQTWTCQGGKPGRVRTWSGRTTHELWRVLTAPLQLSGRTWLVLCPALQTAAMIGVFERLESGELRWPGNGEDNDDDDAEPRDSGATGSVCLESPPFVLDCRARGYPGTLRIVDIRNYGVGAAGAECSPAEIAEYIGSSIRAIVRTLTDRGLGSLQATVASQSWYTYRRKFVRHGVHVHARDQVLALERRSLAGGRTECYRLGKVVGPVYQLDFSSHYCSILRYCSLPVRLRYFGPGPSDLLAREVDARRGIIAEACVRTEYPHLPLSRGGIVIYPVGRFWTVLTGPDLYCALENGEVVGFGAWASYDLERAFQAFATEILRIRREARLVGARHVENWAKALGVSLVGKLAQHGRHWQDTGRRDLLEKWYHRVYTARDGTTFPVRCLAGRLQRLVDHGETRDSCPAIAAYVYAEGRRRLWRAQLAAGRDEVYYSCVDSLFVSETGLKRLASYGLISDGLPGELRLVEVHDWMEIYGINHWRTPGRFVASGVPLSDRQGTAEGTATWVPRPARVSIAGGKAPTAEEYLAHVERISPYRHGVRGPDGRVEPWRIGDGGQSDSGTGGV